MVRVKLSCIMGCPGLKSSYQEKGLFQENFRIRRTEGHTQFHRILSATAEDPEVSSKLSAKIWAIKLLNNYFCHIFL